MKRLTEGTHQTNDTLGMFHFEDHLFAMVHSAKHAHPLGVGDKVGEFFRWKHIVLIEIKDVISKKLGLQIF